MTHNLAVHPGGGSKVDHIDADPVANDDDALWQPAQHLPRDGRPRHDQGVGGRRLGDDLRRVVRPQVDALHVRRVL